MYLGRLVRAIAEHVRTVHNYGEWYREHMEKPDPTPIIKKGSVRLTAPIEEKPVELDQQQKTKGLDIIRDPTSPDCHTPSSILKTDHGYVQASGASLVDFDDTYMMRSRTKTKAVHTQVLSFLDFKSI
jgi:hypothetical protein